jgi:hypothetical protein
LIITLYKPQYLRALESVAFVVFRTQKGKIKFTIKKPKELNIFYTIYIQGMLILYPHFSIRKPIRKPEFSNRAG